MRVPTITCGFVHAKQRPPDQNYKSLSVPDLTCGLWTQKSTFWTRIIGLYGSQTSPVVLCMQYRVISTRITSLYGFQPSSVALRIQKSDFRTRIACLYWSQTLPVVLCMQYSVISTRNTSLYESQPTSVEFACKTAPFGLEQQFSMGPRPHLSFCV